jgi:protein SCO1/2
MFRWFTFLLLTSLLGVSGCGRAPEGASQGKAVTPPKVHQKIFEVKGVVIAVKPKEKAIEIKHEEIPGYMPAMTMPFDVRNTNELAGIQPGDSVSFRMLVTDTEGWIDQIRKLAVPVTNLTANSSPLRLVREVEPLSVGDPLPDYHLTNQFGQAISTAQFKGDALAVTFLFTRCPFPNFCPLMANHFSEVQQKLLSLPNAPTNWHLLTISFDPDFDQPAILKAYAERYKYDPAHSTFATGALIDITALAEQVGLIFSRDQTGNITHNLRTVVVDVSGRIRKIFSGNQWTTTELVQEMLNATNPVAGQ